MGACHRCGLKLDPTTGRHIDHDGDVMDYRDDLIWCRPVDASPEMMARREMLDRIGGLPIACIRYAGADFYAVPQTDDNHDTRRDQSCGR